MEAEAVPETDKGKEKEKARVEETDQQSLPEESAPIVNTTSRYRDRYAKAKIEEPNLQLPKALLKPDCDPNDDLFYMKIFEDDNRKSQHLAEAIAAGAQLDRKVYRIRNEDLAKVLGEDFEGLKEIHRLSKSLIGLLTDAESSFHHHTFLDLVGTVEQVRTAEELILDKILKTYDSVDFPIILMPPTIYRHYIKIPLRKVVRVTGIFDSNINRMEMLSGAWIKVDSEEPPPGGSELERGVHVYGPKAHVLKATSLIHSAIIDPWEYAEMQQAFEEAASDDGKKSAAAAGESSVLKNQTEEEERKNQQVEEDGGKGKQQQVPGEDLGGC